MSDDRAQPAAAQAERARLANVARLTALGALGVQPLIEQLTDSSFGVRREVIAALALIGEAAVGPLCRSLSVERENETRVAAAVDALVASTAAVEEQVFALARDANPAVVADAAQILGRRRSVLAIPTLRGLMQHADDNVAVAAIEALGRVGGRSVVDALVAAVESNHFFRTFPAIDVLGRSGDPRAVPPLSRLLRSSQYTLEAARALGRSGETAAVAPLAALLISGSDAHVRVAALALAELRDRQRERHGTAVLVERALRQANSDAAVRRLTQCLVAADLAEQVAICDLLGALQNAAAAPALTEMLDRSGAVANAAAQALENLGGDADQQLLGALEHGDSARRQVLLPIIARTHGSAAVAPCLEDPDPVVRALACAALARIGDVAVVSALFARLEERNPRVVQAAIGAIQSLGSTQARTLALAAADSPLPGVRRAALRLLAYFGDPGAYDVFVRAVRDTDLQVRDTALACVAFLEHPSVADLLLAATREPAERTRGAAMRGLGQRERNPRAISALFEGLGDPDAWVRYYACQSLGKLGVVEAADALVERLQDDAGQVRVAAVEALSHLQGERAWTALRLAAESSEPDVQRAALIGLGIARRPESLPALLAAARSPDAAMRLVALSALAEFDTSEVVPALARAASDLDDGVRTAALGFLGTRPGVEATTRLIALLQRQKPDRLQPDPRLLAALALPTEGRVEGVALALETADDELAPALTSILARLAGAGAEVALLHALQLANVAARKAAASTLAALGTSEAVAALKHAALADASDEVRRICALLLSQ